MMALEKMQSLKRSPESDSELYASNCTVLRDILDQILRAKVSLKKGADKAKVQSEIDELRVRFGLAFINLKKLNRLDKLRTKRIRENTAGVMQRVDQFHLRLQNLRYELIHLEREVTKCLQFRSADQDVEMVSEEEFLKEAPEDIKRKVDGGDKDGKEHRLRLARLEFERTQRRQMNETVQKLKGEKRSYQVTICEKKLGLTALKPQLKAILEKSRSVQEYLDMPLDEDVDQVALSRHLPHPLFVLYSEMRAYGHACDEHLKVKILGELEKAKGFNAVQRNTEPKTNGEAEEGESSGRSEGALNELTQGHPLTIRVGLDLAARGSVDVEFAYLIQLEIVAVKVTLTDKSGSPITVSPGLLANLMCPDDDGCSSPNPTTFYLMRSRGLESIPEAGAGWAYRWAQILAGFKFPDEMPSEEAAAEETAGAAFNKAVCQARVETVVKAIKQRVLSRIN